MHPELTGPFGCQRHARPRGPQRGRSVVPAFDLRRSLQRLTELLGARAQRNGSNLSCLVEQDVPPFLQGDPARLHQILTSLLGTAVKLTQNAEIVLRVSMDRRNDAQESIRFEVTSSAVWPCQKTGCAGVIGWCWAAS